MQIILKDVKQKYINKFIEILTFFKIFLISFQLYHININLKFFKVVFNKKPTNRQLHINSRCWKDLLHNKRSLPLGVIFCKIYVFIKQAWI